MPNESEQPQPHLEIEQKMSPRGHLEIFLKDPKKRSTRIKAIKHFTKLDRLESWYKLPENLSETEKYSRLASDNAKANRLTEKITKNKTGENSAEYNLAFTIAEIHLNNYCFELRKTDKESHPERIRILAAKQLLKDLKDIRQDGINLNQ